MSLKNLFDDSSKDRIVFVLGAGFSRAAGFPLQSEILSKIRDNIPFTDFMNTPLDIMSTSHFYAHSKNIVFDFLEKIFPNNQNPNLEDVFTLLDQTISEQGYCKDYFWKNLVSVDAELKKALLFVFHHHHARIQADTMKNYTTFAGEIIRRKMQNKNVSIVSLNWDSLLEEAIYQCITDSKANKKIDVDYCCYTNPLDESTEHIPSVTQKAIGIKNIKFLKLHGSTNWLICHRCKRLFTAVGSKKSIFDLYVSPKSCSKCDQNTLEEKSVLQSFIITPTYLKTFPNTHIQNIWDNAYIELAEADKVVFIGYSLPEADYYVRSLLKRAIKTNATVYSVLLGTDKRFDDIKWRYENFFPTKSLSIFKGGVNSIFTNSVRPLEQNIRYIKKKL